MVFEMAFRARKRSGTFEKPALVTLAVLLDTACQLGHDKDKLWGCRVNVFLGPFLFVFVLGARREKGTWILCGSQWMSTYGASQCFLRQKEPEYKS